MHRPPAPAAAARAIALMSRDLAAPWLLDDLARAARFSPFHFHRMFTDVTGTTPARFLTCLRIAEGRRLLLHTALGVAAVGQAVGYASVGTFSTRFSRLVGEPPATFRRLARAAVGLEPEAWPPYVFTDYSPCASGAEVPFRALVLNPGRTLLEALVDHDSDAYLLAEGRLVVTGGGHTVTRVRMRRPRLTDLPPLAAAPLRASSRSAGADRFGATIA